MAWRPGKMCVGAGFLALALTATALANPFNDLPLDEIYHDGAFALIYDGHGEGLRQGDRVPVLRLGRDVGTFVVTSAAPHITRGRFEARDGAGQMKKGDLLDLTQKMANPPKPPPSPSMAFHPNPGMGATLFEPVPYGEVGTSLMYNHVTADEVVTQGSFAMEATQGTTAVRVTPRRGYSLTYAQQEAELASTFGRTGTLTSTLLGVQWSRPLPATTISSNLFPTVGGLTLTSNNPVTGYDDPRYFGYATLTGHYKGATGYFGAGVLGGTGFGRAKPSLLLGLSRPVGERLSLLAGYASRDYLKTVSFNRNFPVQSNHLGLTQSLVCAGCREDALSLGLHYRMGGARGLNLGWYDVLDLGAPSLSLEASF